MTQECLKSCNPMMHAWRKHTVARHVIKRVTCDAAEYLEAAAVASIVDPDVDGAHL